MKIRSPSERPNDRMAKGKLHKKVTGREWESLLFLKWKE